MIHAFIKKGCFQDSVSLMIISRQLSESDDVDDVSIMMGTPANKSLLENTGFWHPDFLTATPNDVCVAIRTRYDDGVMVETVRQKFEEALKTLAQGNAGGSRLVQARRWESACQKLPQANLLLISVAGEYAAELAQQALDNQKNVMIFSDNVPLEQEIALKTAAQKKGLIVMGPDCGTAILAGTPLAFANVMPQGDIGVIGASGTGIQELISQIALAGEGITHAIGLGGRDLSAEVGGISALSALDMLKADPESRVLAFVSKPPADAVRLRIMEAMHATGKPVVALFLGHPVTQRRVGNVWLASTLDEASRLACLLARVARRSAELSCIPGGKICGLYTGGTLAAEAAMLLAEQLGVTLNPAHPQGTMLEADGHRIIDLGDDFYTVGKPHPMIDPTQRNHLIEGLAQRPEIGVLLLDIVIGYGAQADPAGALAASLEICRRRETPLAIIATVTGTEQDPQGRSAQIAALRTAGVTVVDSLVEAVLLAYSLIQSPPKPCHAELPALLQQVSVINAGLRSFAQDLQKSGCPVVHYQWGPVAGGNKKLAHLLARLK
ncbi:acyl-CoA synthetase FdrA [Atlantibacter subterraneus]|uniref:acyl-CoA synthetase FdrA n=1 Tax=Atlantibacter subterraneus TaxID=255519 RepID=UPI002897512D|nr:acyl-CoA synthetase FdrA [Atlantibacter subterranea]